MKTTEDEWQRFLNFCLKLKNKKNFEEFFSLLFTLDEKADLTKRIQVIRLLLEEEMTQRAIAKSVNVSIFKVTRGANALKIVPNRLKKFLKEDLN